MEYQDPNRQVVMWARCEECGADSMPGNPVVVAECWVHLEDEGSTEVTACLDCWDRVHGVASLLDS